MAKITKTGIFLRNFLADVKYVLGSSLLSESRSCLCTVLPSLSHLLQYGNQDNQTFRTLCHKLKIKQWSFLGRESYFSFNFVPDMNCYWKNINEHSWFFKIKMFYSAEIYTQQLCCKTWINNLWRRAQLSVYKEC